MPRPWYVEQATSDATVDLTGTGCRRERQRVQSSVRRLAHGRDTYTVHAVDMLDLVLEL